MISENLDAGRDVIRDAELDDLPFATHKNKTLLVRLPYWMDENLRDAARVMEISPQEFVRRLVAAETGAPQDGWLDRYLQPARDRGDICDIGSDR